jgi:4-methyl-5(b-hydroxyethyl)-thiazole monophosphate biosynthesis
MFDAQNKIIASVCVGALPIALSGILSKRKITDDDNKTALQIEKEKTENVINEPVVFNSNVIISWKPSTAFEVAYLLLERLTSKEHSDFIREMMELRMRQN